MYRNLQFRPYENSSYCSRRCQGRMWKTFEICRIHPQIHPKFRPSVHLIFVLNVCFLQNHLMVLMLLVFEATVYRHQAHHYRQLQRSPPPIPALFHSVTRKTLDDGLVPCFKYLLNYTFYKFGLEVWNYAHSQCMI